MIPTDGIPRQKPRFPPVPRFRSAQAPMWHPVLRPDNNTRQCPFGPNVT